MQGTQAPGCVDAAQPLGSDVRVRGEGRRRPEGRRGRAIHTKLGGFGECAKAEETKNSRVLTRNRIIWLCRSKDGLAIGRG